MTNHQGDYNTFLAWLRTVDGPCSFLWEGRKITMSSSPDAAVPLFRFVNVPLNFPWPDLITDRIM